MLKYFDGGKQQCKLFCDERYVKKSYKLCGTIRKVNIPKFDYKYKKQKFLKPTAKKLGDAQKHLDVARARGILTKKKLCFDNLINNKLFEEDLTLKPEKK